MICVGVNVAIVIVFFLFLYNTQQVKSSALNSFDKCSKARFYLEIEHWMWLESNARTTIIIEPALHFKHILNNVLKLNSNC